MKRLLLVILGGLLLTTCTHRWIAVPQDVPDYEGCNVLVSDPQMLKVPGFSQAYIIVDNCATMDRQRVSIAMYTFLQIWEEHFPHQVSTHRVDEALSSLLTTFNSEKKTANAYTSEGVYGENLPVSGLTLTPGWVWVKMTPGDRLCKSSFVHELVHVAIWAINKSHGDPDHLGGKYPGWTLEHNLVIQETNKVLCEWGI